MRCRGVLRLGELDVGSLAEVLHTRGRAAQEVLGCSGAPRFVSNSTERDPDVSNGRTPAASLWSLKSRAAATEMRAKAYEARSRTLR